MINCSYPDTICPHQKHHTQQGCLGWQRDNLRGDSSSRSGMGMIAPDIETDMSDSDFSDIEGFERFQAGPGSHIENMNRSYLSDKSLVDNYSVMVSEYVQMDPGHLSATRAKAAGNSNILYGPGSSVNISEIEAGPVHIANSHIYNSDISTVSPAGTKFPMIVNDTFLDGDAYRYENSFRTVPDSSYDAGYREEMIQATPASNGGVNLITMTATDEGTYDIKAKNLMPYYNDDEISKLDADHRALFDEVASARVAGDKERAASNAYKLSHVDTPGTSVHKTDGKVTVSAEKAYVVRDTAGRTVVYPVDPKTKISPKMRSNIASQFGGRVHADDIRVVTGVTIEQNTVPYENTNVYYNSLAHSAGGGSTAELGTLPR